MAITEKLHFVLLHGAMHDGSCWDNVKSILQSQGHEAWAPTLAGHGAEAGNVISHADCITSVISFIEQHELDNIVLVGHSFAGIVIPGVSVQLAGRIKRLVFQNAMIVNDGERIYDQLPPVQRKMFDIFIRNSGDKGSWLIPFDLFRDTFVNTADLATAKAVYANLKAVCVQPQLERVAMTEFNRLDIPRSFINLTGDIALPRGEYGWYPRMAERLGRFRLVERPGDHEACYTCPEVLAEALVEAGRV